MMHGKINQFKCLALLLSMLLGSAAFDQASATLMLIGPEDFQGTGLGAVNTILTILDNDGTEQGCVGRFAPPSLGVGGCPGGGLSPTPSDTGRIIGGSLGANEQTGDSQTRTRAASDLGLTTADTLRVVFNALEPGDASNSITLNDLILTIYNADDSIKFFSGSLAAPIFFPDTMTGAGNSGFVFALDAAQAMAAGTLDPTDRIGLSANVSNAQGGLETFFVTPTPIPEPTTLLLFGTGLVGVGIGMRRRGRKES